MGAAVRLTSLAHGGGCGCKLAPAVLRDILATMPAAGAFPSLMVGTETGDDAAVYRLNDTQALVATTDFFTPIVDDPCDFGRIAATNAVSDIYAMGATPILALAIVGMPVGSLPLEAIQAILAGGAEVCAAIGIPVAGGHSIDTPEPIYGLVVLGLVHPARILRNAGARPGDRLVLAKPLGVGVYGAALKRGVLAPDAYDELIASTTQLNRLGADMPDVEGVHALTDVTGFGLLGHALEMCRPDALGLRIQWANVPFLRQAERFAQDGIVTGASARNWAGYGHEVRLAPSLPLQARDLLCDPQTSGGLLIATTPEASEAVLARANARGFARAAIVGTFEAGPPVVSVG